MSGRYISFDDMPEAAPAPEAKSPICANNLGQLGVSHNLIRFEIVAHGVTIQGEGVVCERHVEYGGKGYQEAVKIKIVRGGMNISHLPVGYSAHHGGYDLYE